MHAREAAALSSDIIGESAAPSLLELLRLPLGVGSSVATVKFIALVADLRRIGLDFDFAFARDGEDTFFVLRAGDERAMVAVDWFIEALDSVLAAALPTVAFESVFGDALIGVFFFVEVLGL